jgi:hypothetical protein
MSLCDDWTCCCLISLQTPTLSQLMRVSSHDLKSNLLLAFVLCWPLQKKQAPRRNVVTNRIRSWELCLVFTSCFSPESSKTGILKKFFLCLLADQRILLLPWYLLPSLLIPPLQTVFSQSIHSCHACLDNLKVFFYRQETPYDIISLGTFPFGCLKQNVSQFEPQKYISTPALSDVRTAATYRASYHLALASRLA